MNKVERTGMAFLDLRSEQQKRKSGENDAVRRRTRE
jgi:hypothetical protein